MILGEFAWFVTKNVMQIIILYMMITQSPIAIVANEGLNLPFMTRTNFYMVCELLSIVRKLFSGLYKANRGHALLGKVKSYVSLGKKLTL